MRKVFSTSEVHARDRFALWHDVACQTIVDHTSKPASRSQFDASIEVGALADLNIVRFKVSAMEVSHTVRHIRRAPGDDLFVCQQIAGCLALEQDGRQAILNPGDITLLDPMEPYLGRFGPSSKLLVLKVPRRSLEARTGGARKLALRLVNPVDAEPRLASQFLSLLPDCAEDLRQASVELVRNQALDLIASALIRTVAEEPLRLTAARSVASLNIRAAIEMRLADASLRPEAVAAACGISVRYANSILAQEGLSLGRLIIQRRLEHCRTCLNDEAHAHRPISDIAYRWGFSDMTHFSRLFKKAYGVLPREFRKLRSPIQA
jgi:AraC family transcriptional regulator, positive regulator of tynA and feaB